MLGSRKRGTLNSVEITTCGTVVAGQYLFLKVVFRKYTLVYFGAFNATTCWANLALDLGAVKWRVMRGLERVAILPTRLGAERNTLYAF